MATTTSPLRYPDRLYIGGEWVAPSTDAVIDVIDSASEDLLFQVAEAGPADIGRAVGAAREAFDHGPWPKLSHAERAEYLRRLGAGIKERSAEFADIWARETGILHAAAVGSIADSCAGFDFYAGLADTFPFEEEVPTTSGTFPGGEYGLLVREPVGVVGAIIPWNGPLFNTTHKVCPALLAGCTVVLKASPEAPGEPYIIAEVAEQIGLPPGVLNVVTADREVSELLVTDPRVDKISFTGSTAAGRRIGSIMGGRIGRFTLELGGKSAAVVLDDADIDTTATTLALAECFVAGQVCASLTRIVVDQRKHDELVEALAANFAGIVVGDPFDPATHMGPLAVRRQRDRVEGYIARGVEQGARLVTGGGRPEHLDKGWFIEPTLFSGVSNDHVIAREEIFGPVLSVIPARDEDEAVAIANDSPYGLNASVFTPDIDRARRIAAGLRTGTVGQNAMRADLGIAFGGFKQSGIGREGGKEGLMAYVESKTVILDGKPGARWAGR